ncbi:MAG: aryl-sulfate sulfotransferase [Bacteroidia bacterium]|nr:aryl-sulfate sulfotransferase [Bacteroidia bacterium]
MNKRLLLLPLAIILLSSCDKQTPAPGDLVVRNVLVEKNPHKFVPLSAVIHLETNISTEVSVRVTGKRGSLSDVEQEFPGLSKDHEVPILGLYPGYLNEVTLTFTDSTGMVAGEEVLQIQTDALPSDYPSVTVSSTPGPKAEGMTLVSYFGHNSDITPQRPFIFDQFGDIRWYLETKSHPTLYNLFFDDGIERLSNGNLYFGDANSSTIYEVSMLGEIVNTWSFDGYSFHHQVLELPNGNFLLSATKQGEATVEDFILELDRNSGDIVTVWDLRQSLDMNRETLTGDRVDWLHVNAVSFDPSDNTILISGRTQGVAKLTWANEVVWIMGNHSGWGLAGNGIDLTQKLLTPLDASSNPITDSEVLMGNKAHADFDWNWYQHAIDRLPNGDFMLFDNGDNRHFGASPSYSRMVEYRVNPANMTIQQIWEYGKNRGEETYSRIVSDVDYHAESNTVIFSPGAVITGPKPYGKAIEIDRSSGQVLFEATITPPQAAFGLVTFHRTERLTLYP